MRERRKKTEEVLITQADVDEALGLLNSNVNDNEARLKAREIILSWELQGVSVEEKSTRNAYVLEKIGAVNQLQSPSPFLGDGRDWVTPGRKRDTGIIAPTSTGTGLARQEKTPRDL